MPVINTSAQLQQAAVICVYFLLRLEGPAWAVFGLGPRGWGARAHAAPGAEIDRQLRGILRHRTHDNQTRFLVLNSAAANHAKNVTPAQSIFERFRLLLG